jgi:hypothetical protein
LKRIGNLRKEGAGRCRIGREVLIEEEDPHAFR